jgi:hypothetical protein
VLASQIPVLQQLLSMLSRPFGNRTKRQTMSFASLPENLVPKLVPDFTELAELLGRISLYRARFGPIDGFRLDS